MTKKYRFSSDKELMEEMTISDWILVVAFIVHILYQSIKETNV